MSLDPITADRVRRFLLNCVREFDLTILLTTHNLQEAETMCDRLAFINKGRLQFVGTPRDFGRSVTVHEIVKVDAPDQQVVAELLQQLPGASHIAIDDAIRLYGDDGFSLLRETVMALDAANIKASVSMVEPSLEDAFSIFVNNGIGESDG